MWCTGCRGNELENTVIERRKYPRTSHLPWSPGAADDDVYLSNVACFTGREVVVTEKLDGENMTLYNDGLHARSLDSVHHPSRSWVKAFHAQVCDKIPPGWRICGENLHARHSIAYDQLESYFYSFSVWNGNWCLNWDTTTQFLEELSIPAVPVLWRGTFSEATLHSLEKALDISKQEGYVIRTVEWFNASDFASCVAKWVRPDYVQTNQHWRTAEVIPNNLSSHHCLHLPANLV